MNLAMISDTINKGTIRLLPTHLVNQIAAGEVIERPSSVVKELVENSLDAGATNILVQVTDGGKNKIVIQDNGKGMQAAELTLAVQRHATSKLPDNDLVNIKTMGFRGEALPSIGSISRLEIASRTANTATGYQITVEGGSVQPVKPAACKPGTCITVRDIFYATPARLKFLKSTTTEIARIHEVIQQLAMANPQVSFCVEHNNRKTLSYAAEKHLARLQAIMGKDFADNAARIEVEKPDCKLQGYGSIPTYNRGNAKMQFLFVNSRPVKDRLLNAAIRVAYQDFLSRDRHPYVALFLEINPEYVDVNAHPAKTEVRFTDAAAIRGLVISALRQTLQANSQQASTTIAGQTLNAFQPAIQRPAPVTQPSFSYQPQRSNSIPPSAQSFVTTMTQPLREENIPIANHDVPPMQKDLTDYPLGAAVAQIHKTYIVAQSSDGLVLIDQHAAHERLTYEAMKRELQQTGIRRQALLSPEIVDLDAKGKELILEKQQELTKLGLLIEPFGQSIIIKEVPALLKNVDAQQLVRDISEELKEHGSALSLTGCLHELYGNMACKNSIKAGRVLHQEEMNALLRKMEETPHSGQCNHGRPTYVKLHLNDIEKLFGRR